MNTKAPVDSPGLFLLNREQNVKVIERTAGFMVALSLST
jgi:hypothetical protein